MGRLEFCVVLDFLLDDLIYFVFFFGLDDYSP